MRTKYDPKDWFWMVGDDDTRAYSSAAKAYVAITAADPERVTRIASEVFLQDVLLHASPASAFQRAFSVVEIMEALDAVDHDKVASAFAAGEIAAPSPVLAERLRNLAGEIDFLLGSITDEPSPVPASISDRQFFQQLAIAGIISTAEALAAVKTGDIPAALASIVGTLPPEEQFNAEMLLSGATVFERSHPLTTAIGAAQEMDEGEIDDFFRVAALL